MGFSQNLTGKKRREREEKNNPNRDQAGTATNNGIMIPAIVSTGAIRAKDLLALWKTTILKQIPNDLSRSERSIA